MLERSVRFYINFVLQWDHTILVAIYSPLQHRCRLRSIRRSWSLIFLSLGLLREYLIGIDYYTFTVWIGVILLPKSPHFYVLTDSPITSNPISLHIHRMVLHLGRIIYTLWCQSTLGGWFSDGCVGRPAAKFGIALGKPSWHSVSNRWQYHRPCCLYEAVQCRVQHMAYYF